MLNTSQKQNHQNLITEDQSTSAVFFYRTVQKQHIINLPEGFANHTGDEMLLSASGVHKLIEKECEMR